MDNVTLNFPKVSQEEWKQLVHFELKGKEFNETLVWNSLEEINVKPYFSKEDIDYAHLTPLKKNSETKIIAKYNDLFFTDVDGFIVNKESGQDELYEKLFFLTDESLKTNSKSSNYLLFDLFRKAEKEADYNLDIEKAKTVTESATYKKSLLVDISLHQNAGANISQQLGIALAKVNEYVNVLGKSAPEKVYFKFAIGSNYFFEIAKLRAFHILWQNFIAQYQLDTKAFVLCESSMRNKSTLDVENNLIRATLEAAAAFIGNADAVFIADYTRWDADDPSVQEAAYKQQLVLVQESILSRFEDPMAGSYYVESLTEFLVKQAWKNFQEIESEGGYLQSLKDSKIQKRIIAQARKEQEAFDSGKIVLIGVNKFPKDPVAQPPKATVYNPKIIKPNRLAESFE
ncbi:MAG: methylmalonyl-CoA mutase family protein [Flavobacteriaceae bacterium]|jgi:methylmalonyl-CoA mutase|nr:methylmalonyl-CoA mutase family protein [Flavobacteriaceae bacterium]